MNLTQDELTDVIGEHLESLIALFVGLIGRLNNFSVANEIVIAGERYRYQFVLGRQGKEFYRQMEEEFKEAGLVEE